MQEAWIQSLGQEDSLEKETATHSSILLWKIWRIEEPSRLQSMGSQVVEHNWATESAEDSEWYFKLINWETKSAGDSEWVILQIDKQSTS